MNKSLRFGVLGTGRITRRLVADLQSTEGVEVTAIGSRMISRAQWSADQYGIGAAEGDYAAVIERDDVDAIYVATEPSSHADLCIAAAAAGKHVLCEKPLSVDLESSLAMAAAFENSSATWLDATAWLHHQRTAAFSNWIEQSRLGDLTHISASVSFYHPFQSNEHRLDAALGGGCRLDIGWYAAGLIVWAGGMPEEVYAQAEMTNDVEMRVTAMLRCPDNVTATLSCGYDTASRKWFEVAGSRASLICDDFTRPWPDRPARCWIHQSTGEVESATFEGCQERRMIETFRDAICEDVSALAPLQKQCLSTAAVLDAIDQSRRCGHPVEPVQP